MKNFLKRLFQKKQPIASLPSPAIAQVEVTTRCNFKCLMCPRTISSGEKNMDMSWDIFEKFSGFFPKLNLVYLQGWGEPLLHPRIFDMAALVNGKNAQVGFTTNGSLLDQDAISEILRIPMNYVTISLSGADPATHDNIRVGSDFDNLLGKVSNLVTAKKKAGLTTPSVHLSFMVTRQSISSLPDMVRKAAEIGIDRLIAPNLDAPATREAEDQRVFGFEEPDNAFQSAIDEAHIIANKLKVKLNTYPLKLSDDILICELNPVRQFFVNIHGEVAPCAYASIRGRNDFNRYFQSEKILSAPLTFGSLAEERLEDIWEKPEYRRFRIHYHNREQACKNLSMNQTGIHSIFGLQDYLKEIDQTLAKHPVPDFCRKCYKAYGA